MYKAAIFGHIPVYTHIIHTDGTKHLTLLHIRAQVNKMADLSSRTDIPAMQRATCIAVSCLMHKYIFVLYTHVN